MNTLYAILSILFNVNDMHADIELIPKLRRGTPKLSRLFQAM